MGAVRKRQTRMDQELPGDTEPGPTCPLDSSLGRFWVSTDGCVWTLGNLRVEGQRARAAHSTAVPPSLPPDPALRGPLAALNDPTRSGLWCVSATGGTPRTLN